MQWASRLPTQTSSPGWMLAQSAPSSDRALAVNPAIDLRTNNHILCDWRYCTQIGCGSALAACKMLRSCEVGSASCPVLGQIAE